jgi:hypothetical protein
MIKRQLFNDTQTKTGNTNFKHVTEVESTEEKNVFIEDEFKS